MLAANPDDLSLISRTYIVERENSFLQVHLDMGVCVYGVWLVCVCVTVCKFYACVKVCELYVCGIVCELYVYGIVCELYVCYSMWIVCVC